MKNICSLLLTLCILLLSNLGFAESQKSSNDFVIQDKYGRWEKLGESVNDFPICYQLWSCDKSHLNRENQEIQKNKLPSGEWGLCENYLSPDPDNPTFCSQCDVSPPEDLCY